MEDEHFQNKFSSNTFDKFLLVFVQLLRIVLKEILPLENIKGNILDQEDFVQIIRDGFKKLLIDEKYKDFIEEFNFLYNTKLELSEDIVKINKLIISMPKDKLKKIYNIIQLVILISDNTNPINDETDNALCKTVLPNSENNLFKIPAVDKIKTASRTNSTKMFKKNEDNKSTHMNQRIENNILCRKKQKCDQMLDTCFIELAENAPYIKYSNGDKPFSSYNEIKHLNDELGSISTYSTKCKTKYSTNSNIPINKIPEINKIFISSGENINDMQTLIPNILNTSHLMKTKTKLINSAKLFELESGSEINNRIPNYCRHNYV